jgi:DNA-binding transcriptional regulator YhcF (GntR family)
VSGRAPQADWRHAVRDCDELDVYETAVALVLSTYLRNDRAFPSLRILAAGAKVSQPTAIRALARLEQLGFLIVARRLGRGGNTYVAVTPNAQQPVEHSGSDNAQPAIEHSERRNAQREAEKCSTTGEEMLNEAPINAQQLVEQNAFRKLSECQSNAPTPEQEGISRTETKPPVRYTGCRLDPDDGPVRDPLGTDPPPEGWPHPEPTSDELVAAVAARFGVRRHEPGA